MSNKLKLYLDDCRIPIDKEWILVRDYDEFVEVITQHGLDAFEVISLDHDLGEQAMNEYFTNVQKNYTLEYNNIENEKTGMDCCKFLVNTSLDTGIPLPQIFVHSANPIGSGNMMGYINNYLMNQRLPQSCIRWRLEHELQKSSSWIEASRKYLENKK